MAKLAVSILFRMAEILFTRREGRFATLKALEESKRIKRDEMTALSKVYIAAMINKTDNLEEVYTYLAEAEPVILRHFGRYSFEYAKYLSAKSRVEAFDGNQ